MSSNIEPVDRSKSPVHSRADELREKALLMKEPTTAQRKQRRRTFVASTTDVDSHGDVVEQNWNLDRFLKNPVVLWAHDKGSLPIGKCVSVGMVGDHLECEVEFAPESANPFAEQVYQMCEGGFVKAVSVSFWPADIRWEKRDGEDVCVCSNNELFEISVLPIGSNSDALAKSISHAGSSRGRGAERDDLSDIEALLDKAEDDEDEDREKGINDDLFDVESSLQRGEREEREKRQEAARRDAFEQSDLGQFARDLFDDDC